MEPITAEIERAEHSGDPAHTSAPAHTVLDADHRAMAPRAGLTVALLALIALGGAVHAARLVPDDAFEVASGQQGLRVSAQASAAGCGAAGSDDAPS